MSDRHPIQALLVAAVLCVAPGAAGADPGLLDEGFEAFTGIPRTAASELDTTEMEDLRGGFLGFFFEVTFAGFVDPAGASTGELTVNAGVDGNFASLVIDPNGATGGPGPAPSSQPVASNADFRVAAGIGQAFSGAQGAFQISQIPGSNVSLRQALVVNVAVIQANPSDVSSLRAQLAPMFGF